MSLLNHKIFFTKFRRRIANKLSWVIHPISVFVILQVVWVAILVIWVNWFFGSREELAQVSRTLGQDHIVSGTALGVLIAGIVLLVVILIGTVALFVWGQRQTNLIGQQRSFVSSVTHELRSPLASLQLVYETLRARALPEATKNQLLDMGLLDIERLVKLVDQILISARLDRGIVMFQNDVLELSIRHIVTEVIGSLTFLDHKIVARVKLKCDPSLAFTMSKGALALIVGNLLENAIKYSPKDSPINISVDLVDKRLMLNIQDYGFGLEKRERKRIFKMFYRGSLATLKAIPGTGLGLFIVKTIVAQLGGEVKVYSLGKGLGSTFQVLIPPPVKEGTV